MLNLSKVSLFAFFGLCISGCSTWQVDPKLSEQWERANLFAEKQFSSFGPQVIAKATKNFGQPTGTGPLISVGTAYTSFWPWSREIFWTFNKRVKFNNVICIQRGYVTSEKSDFVFERPKESFACFRGTNKITSFEP